MSDPRIDPLNSAAVLTDTQLRLSFAPVRKEARVVALEKSVHRTDIMDLETRMQQGKVHFQIKAGFAPERSIELTGAELLLLLEMSDRFITNLPRVDDNPAGE